MATASTPRTARTRAPKAPAPLTESQMREFFALVKGADSVELKLTVPGDDHRAAIQALGMDPLNAQIRQVYFYDTPDLTLNAAGLVVRSRRIQGKGGDTVVKLRPVQPDELSRELRKNPSVNVEVDAMPGGLSARRPSRASRASTTHARWRQGTRRSSRSSRRISGCSIASTRPKGST